MSNSLSRNIQRRSRAIWVWLRGPRFVDAPIRTVLFLIALVGILPSARESGDAGYLVLHYLSCALIVAGGFAPRTVGVASTALFLAFHFGYPDFLNPFQVVIEVVTAVLISSFRWGAYATFSAILFAVFSLAGGADSVSVGGMFSLVFGWLLGSILGLIAGLSEQRIQREVAERERSARANQKAIDELRRGFAIDAHDTVSHGLTAQAAIVSVLTTQDEVRPAQLTELALITAQTQQQLRALLARLSGATQQPDSEVAFDIEFRSAVESRAAVLRAGGFDVDVIITGLPRRASVQDLETCLFLFQELATNIVKHATAPVNCSITVEATTLRGDPGLRLRSRNPGASVAAEPPRSLSLRSEQSGGSCALAHNDGWVVVEVLIPVSASELAPALPRTRYT